MPRAAMSALPRARYLRDPARRCCALMLPLLRMPLLMAIARYAATTAERRAAIDLLDAAFAADAR